MRQELQRLMKDIDAAAARLNAGLGAVAVALSVTLALTLTVKLAQLLALLDAQFIPPIGP
ncbi:MAG TPA: hypothetical protein VE397_10770 [Stellaceae bacterium]|nr:hypothetical protein [Stellaceae bacterium]